jgi:tetratricopeptide (TPR) repeat protein
MENNNPFPEESAEIRELLRMYRNLREGRPGSFLEEEDFEKLILHFDEQENLKEAFRVAETGLSIFPYSALLYLKKADLLLTDRKYEQALEILDEVELLDASSSELVILKTEAYLALDQQEKAIPLLEDALTRFEGQERIELLFELSDVYDDYEQFDKVFDCLKIILEEDPINEEALYKICFWTDYTGRNEESIRLHNKIIDQFPYTELAWFNLGAAYQGLKLFEKAIDAYLYCVAIDEKFDYAYRNMGDAYIRMRKYREAIEMLEKVVELSPPEDVIFKAIAYCYEKLKQPAQARLYYRKASHLSPDDGQLYYKIACTYIDEGKHANAVKQLRQALKINRKNSDYNMAMGYALMGVEDFQQAMEHFVSVADMRPKSEKGWCGVLDCLAQVQNWKQVGITAEMAYQATGKKPVFLIYQAISGLTTGKVKQGLLLLEEAMQKSPKMVRKLIEINPSLLQYPQVVDFLAKHKRSRKKKS